MSSNGRYIFDAHGEPVPCDDLFTWGTWMGKADRHLALDHVGSSKISTVFLGLDHRFDNGSPVLWETMVFGGPLDGAQDRYSSREDALAGHAAIVARVKKERDS